jgi:hypothetical protein
MIEKLDVTEGERGIALITSLLASTLILALGMAVLFSATSGTVATMNQRTVEQSFLAADAGLAIARQSLAATIQKRIDDIANGVQGVTLYSNPSPVAGQFPAVQVFPKGDPQNYKDWYQTNILTPATALAQSSDRLQKFSDLNGTKFAVKNMWLSGSVTPNYLNAQQATEVQVLRYTIEVEGRTASGATSTVRESGYVSDNISLAYGSPSSTRNFSFSGFSVFFDSGDPLWYAVLCPGTFSGAVHTNTDFSFYAGWQYNFRSKVTQVNPNIRYWDSNGPNNWIPIPTQNLPAITLGPQGYHQASAVALPTNTFSQEYAVINSTGITNLKSDGTPVDPPPIQTDQSGNPLTIFDSKGRVTGSALAANLRDASNAAPTLQSGALPQGVYIASSDGSSMTGAGFYIQGDVTDFKLYADSSVDPNYKNADQVYVITQGTTTTTIRVSYLNNTTSVTNSSGHTTVYTGLPTDRSDPSNPQSGAVVFTNGSIWSFRGGIDGSQKNPAVAAQTHLTIASPRHIKLTGDITYADPVVNPDGTPVANINNVQNVLGLFTSDGNIFLDAKYGYVAGPGLSIQMNGAFCVFNNDTTDDNGASEGGITTWFGSGHQSPGYNDGITLIGSDVEALNSLVDYYNANEYYDVRFAGGAFRPPFFPGTTYSLQTPPPSVVSIRKDLSDSVAATAMTWQRESK